MRGTSERLPVRFAAILLLALPAACARSARALAADAPDVVRQLLDVPAPARDWREVTRTFGEGEVPPDDAPTELLVAFWASGNAGGMLPGEPPGPSNVVRGRLLDAVLERPGRLGDLLHQVPETADAFTTLTALRDRLPDPFMARHGRDLRADLSEWLARFRFYAEDDVLRVVRAAASRPAGVDPAAERAALAKLDWAAAPVLVQRNAWGITADAAEASSELTAAAKAMARLYERYVREGNAEASALLRFHLIGFAEDDNAPEVARLAALDALMADVEWEHRDEWFLSRLADPSLTPAGPVRRERDRWVPILSRLVGSPDRATHDNAVACLVQFAPAQANADMLRPLLPWLSDPKWASANGRWRLVWALSRVHVPESVPGLTWIVQNTTEEHADDDTSAVEYYLVGAAAEALAHYEPKEAGPHLRERFEEGDGRGFGRDEDTVFVRAMLAAGELADAKIVEAVEAHARDLVTPPQPQEHGLFEEHEKPVSLPLRLGRQLARLDVSRNAAGERLLARVAALRVCPMRGTPQSCPHQASRSSRPAHRSC